MKKLKISNNVIRRLPRYLRKLDELAENGVTRISSFDLGQHLGFTPSQIRQDFSCFGEFGQQGYGYNVAELRHEVGTILGMDRGLSAILIGCGNIGRAMLDNFCFSNWGVTLKAAFDVNSEIIGSNFNGITVFSMENLAEYLTNNKIDIAVLTVPKEVAKNVAQNLIDSGIGAIWNFTNVELTEPNSPILVENVHFSDSLLSLSYYITERQNDEAAKLARLAKANSVK